MRRCFYADVEILHSVNSSTIYGEIYGNNLLTSAFMFSTNFRGVIWNLTSRMQIPRGLLITPQRGEGGREVAKYPQLSMLGCWGSYKCPRRQVLGENIVFYCFVREI